MKASAPSERMIISLKFCAHNRPDVETFNSEVPMKILAPLFFVALSAFNAAQEPVHAAEAKIEIGEGRYGVVEAIGTDISSTNLQLEYVKPDLSEIRFRYDGSREWRNLKRGGGNTYFYSYDLSNFTGWKGSETIVVRGLKNFDLTVDQQNLKTGDRILYTEKYLRFPPRACE